MHHHRKKRKVSIQSQPSQQARLGNTNASEEEDFRPREERAYAEFPRYHSLHSGTPIRLLLLGKNDHSEAKEKFISCSSTAQRELTRRIAAFRDTLPKTSFQILRERRLLDAAPKTVGKAGEKRKLTSAASVNYTQYLAPTEAELAQQVEYDMDEEDFQWLAMMNLSRKRASCPPVMPFIFEIVMDKLEKEWFALTKNLQRKIHQQEMSCLPDDLLCEICGESDTSNSNVIVICDGCDLPVHQECYGIPFVPEGPWLCRRCLLGPAGPESKLQCLLCPDWWPPAVVPASAAFKQTVDGNWVHSVCAFWVNETFPLNDAYQEPVGGLDKIPSARWKLTCCVCGKKKGAAIQCSSKNCKSSYHATCAKRAGFVMDCGDKVTYCQKHSQIHRTLAVPGDDAAVSDDEDNTAGNDPSSSKEGLFNRKLLIEDEGANSEEIEIEQTEASSLSFLNPNLIINDSERDANSGSGHVVDKNLLNNGLVESALSSSIASSSVSPPSVYPVGKVKLKIPQVINSFIFDKLQVYMSEYEIKKKKEFLLDMARYWSLKREARKGIPLLKRLHQEYNNMLWSEKNEEFERTAKQRYFELMYLKKDLQRLKHLLYVICQRERAKRNYFVNQKEMFIISSKPLNFYLYQILFYLRSFDPREIFAFPVPVDLVPGYLDLIKEPMDFHTMQTKIDSLQYGSLDEFERDFNLVVGNAMTFNKPSTIYYKAAVNLSEQGTVILQNVRRILEQTTGDPMLDRLGEFTCHPSLQAEQQAEPQATVETEIDTEAFKQVMDAMMERVDSEEIDILNNDDITENSTFNQQVLIQHGDTKKHEEPKNGEPFKKSNKRHNSSEINVSERQKDKDSNITRDELVGDRHKRFQASFDVEPNNNKTEIVWAKLGGFPWWPALKVSLRDKKLLKDAPESLLDHVRNGSPIEALVKFFDSTNSWASVPYSKISELGEDFEEERKRLDIRNGKKISQLKSFFVAALNAKHELNSNP